MAADFGFGRMKHHIRSGLELTLWRQYSSNLGRWISRDALGEGVDENLYAYVRNIPTMLIDPSGLKPQDVIEIIDTSRSSMRKMSENGERIDLGPLSGPLSNLGKPFFPKLKGCGDQASEVHNELLQKPNLIKDWNFDLISINAPLMFPPAPSIDVGLTIHQLLIGKSSYPGDPLMIIDPWTGLIINTPFGPPTFDPLGLPMY